MNTITQFIKKSFSTGGKHKKKIQLAIVLKN